MALVWLLEEFKFLPVNSPVFEFFVQEKQELRNFKLIKSY